MLAYLSSNGALDLLITVLVIVLLVALILALFRRF